MSIILVPAVKKTQSEALKALEENIASIEALEQKRREHLKLKWEAIREDSYMWLHDMAPF